MGFQAIVWEKNLETSLYKTSWVSVLDHTAGILINIANQWLVKKDKLIYTLLQKLRQYWNNICM